MKSALTTLWFGTAVSAMLVHSKNSGDFTMTRQRCFNNDSALCYQRWFSSEASLSSLDTAQHRQARSELLFTSFEILNIDKIFSYNIGLMMYKFHHRKLPLIFDDFFTRNAEIHSHHTRQSNCLHVPLFSTETGKRSFRFKAVIVWNDLRRNLKSVNIRISTFKLHLKKYLICN